MMYGTQSQEKWFCEFKITDSTTVVIESFLAAFTFLLVARGLLNFWRLKDSLNRHTVFAYTIITLWWLAYLAEFVVGLVLYEKQRRYPKQYDQLFLSRSSRYLWATAWADAFMIQAVLLYVPYQWSFQILNLFHQLGRMSDLEDSETALKHYKGKQRIIYQTLKIYTLARIIYVAFPVLFVVVQDHFFFVGGLSCHLIDCVILTFVLTLGMISLKKSHQLKETLDEFQSMRMFNQYLLLIIASLCRFIFDAMMAANFRSKSYKGTCSFTDPNDVQDAVLNAVATITTHLLPIFIILRIYSIEERPNPLRRSLVIASSLDRDVQPNSPTGDQ